MTDEIHTSTLGIDQYINQVADPAVRMALRVISDNRTENAAAAITAGTVSGVSVVATGLEVTGTADFDGVVVVSKSAAAGMKLDPASPTYGWHDIIGNVQPKAQGVGSPARAVYSGGTVADYAFAANDVCDFVFHIPHDYVIGTDLFFHVHWSHTGTTISGSVVFDIFYTYAKGHNQADFPAEKNLTVTYSPVDVATTPRYRHRIDEVAATAADATATLMDRDLIEPDGLFIATLKMTTLPTLGGGGKLFVHTCDIHYQSTDIGTKQKAPPFYT